MFEIKQRSYILGLSLDRGKDSRHFLMIFKDNHGTLKPTDRDTILHPRRECTLGPNPTSEEEMDMKSRTKEIVASLFKNTDVNCKEMLPNKQKKETHSSQHPVQRRKT